MLFEALGLEDVMWLPVGDAESKENVLSELNQHQMQALSANNNNNNCANFEQPGNYVGAEVPGMHAAHEHRTVPPISTVMSRLHQRNNTGRPNDCDSNYLGLGTEATPLNFSNFQEEDEEDEEDEDSDCENDFNSAAEFQRTQDTGSMLLQPLIETSAYPLQMSNDSEALWAWNNQQTMAPVPYSENTFCPDDHLNGLREHLATRKVSGGIVLS